METHSNDTLVCRRAVPDDAEPIADIYNQGMEDRIATFETRLRNGKDVREWINTDYPVVVGTVGTDVISFAVAHQYSSRECYLGIGEFSVYVRRDMRGRGIGHNTMQYFIHECRESGMWKLVSRVFPENSASRKMLRSLGFREVGVYRNHAKLDGIWKDVVIVEYLIDQK